MITAPNRAAPEKSNREPMEPTHSYSALEHLLFPSTSVSRRKLRRRLEGRTVLITGASYGIGECLAHQLADTGARLILVARTEEKLLAVKQEVERLGGKAVAIPADLTRPEDVENLLKALEALPGGVDVVVNNAGKSIRRSVYESLHRYHDFVRTMALNYFGPVRLILGLIPSLESNQGHVINISAVNVLLIPAARWSAYQASKTAFDQWFRCVAPELNARGIHTSVIYLPLVKTRMIAPTEAYDTMPAMRPDHVGRVICRAITTRRRKFAPWWLIFGQIASIVLRYPWELMAAMRLRRKP